MSFLSKISNEQLQDFMNQDKIVQSFAPPIASQDDQTSQKESSPGKRKPKKNKGKAKRQQEPVNVLPTASESRSCIKFSLLRDLLIQLEGKSLSNETGRNLPIRGIKNAFSCCYLNAMFQCFLHLPELVLSLRTIIEGSHFESDSSIIEGKPVLTMCLKMALMYYPNLKFEGIFDREHSNSKPINLPHEVYSALGLTKNFQEDSAECFNNLLCSFHEEIMIDELKEKPKIIDDSHTGDWCVQGCNGKARVKARPTNIAGGQNNREDTFIKKLFVGSQTIRLSNDAHQFVRAVQEPFFVLPIWVANLTSCSMRDCIQHLANVETIDDYQDSKTMRKFSVQKKMLFDRLPNYLVLHLKRFHVTGSQITKSMSLVSVDLSLNIPTNQLSRENTGASGRSRNYNLMAVIFHVGLESQRGHYTAAIRQDKETFTYIDDERSCELRGSAAMRNLLSSHSPLNAGTGTFAASSSEPSLLAQSSKPKMDARPSIGQQPRTPYLCIYSNIDSFE